MFMVASFFVASSLLFDSLFMLPYKCLQCWIMIICWMLFLSGLISGKLSYKEILFWGSCNAREGCSALLFLSESTSVISSNSLSKRWFYQFHICRYFSSPECWFRMCFSASPIFAFLVFFNYMFAFTVRCSIFEYSDAELLAKHHILILLRVCVSV